MLDFYSINLVSSIIIASTHELKNGEEKIGLRKEAKEWALVMYPISNDLLSQIERSESSDSETMSIPVELCSKSWKVPIQVLVETSRDPKKLKKPKRNKGQLDELPLSDEVPSKKYKDIQEIVEILKKSSEENVESVKDWIQHNIQ